MRKLLISILGRYWLSSPDNSTKGYYVSFGMGSSITSNIRPQSNVNKDNGHSVRLVHDTIVPPKNK